jgi:hypothetical protein
MGDRGAAPVTGGCGFPLPFVFPFGFSVQGPVKKGSGQGNQRGETVEGGGPILFQLQVPIKDCLSPSKAMNGQSRARNPL